MPPGYGAPRGRRVADPLGVAGPARETIPPHRIRHPKGAHHTHPPSRHRVPASRRGTPCRAARASSRATSPSRVTRWPGWSSAHPTARPCGASGCRRARTSGSGSSRGPTSAGARPSCGRRSPPGSTARRAAGSTPSRGRAHGPCARPWHSQARPPSPRSTSSTGPSSIAGTARARAGARGGDPRRAVRGRGRVGVAAPATRSAGAVRARRRAHHVRRRCTVGGDRRGGQGRGRRPERVAARPRRGGHAGVRGRPRCAMPRRDRGRNAGPGGRPAWSPSRSR